MNHVVYSETEKFSRGRDAIAAAASKCVQAVHFACYERIQEVGLRAILGIPENVVYFLTNLPEITGLAKQCSVAARVVNAEYYQLRTPSKLADQEAMERDGIRVPRRAGLREFGDFEYPCFVKLNRHCNNQIRLTRNAQEAGNFIAGLSPEAQSDYYLEKLVEGSQMEARKIYFIPPNFMVCMQNESVPSLTQSVMRRIAECLRLEVFSADLFVDSEGHCTCIDVNPASAFFLSARARDLFLSWVLR